MANFTTSPGVAISEIDNTFLTGQPIQAGAAIIGPTVTGPVENPILVTSYSDFKTIFGDIFISGGNSYSYLTSIAAFNYFNYGGTSLLVTRVVSGSGAAWAPAVSTTISNYLNSTSSSFELETYLKECTRYISGVYFKENVIKFHTSNINENLKLLELLPAGILQELTDKILNFKNEINKSLTI